MHESLKTLVELWLIENDIKDCSVVGLGKGHRGVEMFTHKVTAEKFIEEHEMIETDKIKGWFTPSRYSKNLMYISIQKKK